MASTNIPTSLSTTTQIPVDSKTYKNTLSEITTVTSEQAYTYYAGMRVDIAANNKQYVWKQTIAGETPVSNIFTYAAAHIVEGYDYSNKSFAFYEIIIDNTPLPPEPDTRVIYYPNINNQEYNPTPSANLSYSTLVRAWDSSEPNENNVVTVTAEISPVASNSLRVFHAPINLYNPGSHIPLRIETYPDNAVVIGDEGEYPTIEEAVEDGHSSVVFPPINGEVVLPGPISGDISVYIPGNSRIRTDISDMPIFSNNGNDQKLFILNDSVVELESPLVASSGVGAFKIKGGTVTTTPGITSPIIKTSSVSNVVGATVNTNGFVIQLDNVTIENTDNTFGSFSDNTHVYVKDANIIESNSTRNFIQGKGYSLDVNNTNINVENTGIASLFVIDEYSSLNVNNSNISGSVVTLTQIDASNNDISPKLLINNSNLESLQAERLVGSNLISLNTINIKINNSQVINSGVITKSVEGISLSNVISNDGTSLTPLQLNKYINRERALVTIAPYSLFINTNENNVDRSTWFIDVAIPANAPLA